MNASLRVPTETDYLHLASWILDADACRAWAGPRIPFPFSPSALSALLALDGGVSYCLDGGVGAPVGFGQYWPRPDDTVHLLRIIVAPNQRGKGLGRELCRRLIAVALDATGATAVTLNVYPDDAAAVSLYWSLGFREDGSRSRGDSLFMRLARYSANCAP